MTVITQAGVFTIVTILRTWRCHAERLLYDTVTLIYTLRTIYGRYETEKWRTGLQNWKMVD